MTWQSFVANFALRDFLACRETKCSILQIVLFQCFSTPCLIIYKFSISACLLASLSPDFIRTLWNVLEVSRASAAPQNTVPHKVIISTLLRRKR